MAILINEQTRYLIQGITGKQGQLACEEMLKEGSLVAAGVTPGKGGQNILGVPVYNSVAEAKEKQQIDVSVVLVPARNAKEAIIEAITAGIPLINIITENIPIHDAMHCLALAKKQGVRIIGPTSIGIFSVGKSKCGAIASGKSRSAFTPGPIGIISRSGGMACETALVLKQAGLGQSTVVGTGADVIMGDSYVELLQDFEMDPETKGIVLFAEIGGTVEEDLAAYLLARKKQGNPYPKPIAAFVSGKFAENYHLQNVSLGHAGAIIEGDKGSREHKVNVLRQAGVEIVEVHHEIGQRIKELITAKPVETNLSSLKASNLKKKYQTRISKLQDEDMVIRGIKLSNLIQNSKYTDAMFLQLSGRNPAGKESIIFEKLLISIIDHGMGTTSSLASRVITSGGNSLQVGVAGGILSLGDYHGGAIEKAMRQFYELIQLKDLAIEQIITRKIENKEIIFGFGHKHYKDEDPRVNFLIKELKRLNYDCKFLKLKSIIEQAFLKIKGKKLPLNIDGFLAMVLCSFAFDPLLGKGIFIIGRTSGLVAQCQEELLYEKPVRRIDEDEIEYIGL